jgi:trehalose synthase
MPPETVDFFARSLDRFRDLLGDARYREIEAAAAVARSEFAGRAIWHINSTARGGGVAELLGSLLPYVRGAGIDTRWIAIRGDAEFFRMTKRLHNHLHGDPGDGGPPERAERRIYEATLAGNADALGQTLRAGDIAYLHDPQTAGMAQSLKELGLKVIWRCHIGVDQPDDLVRASWDFLRPYVEAADARVFSRREYVWDGIDPDGVWLMPPAIDPFSAKNQELSDQVVDSILATIGLVADRESSNAACFTRADGTPGRVDRQGRVLQTEPLPPTARLVAQVSRWDRLKDPQGVIAAFERHLDDPDAHLALVAPSTEAVSDDPEGSAVYQAVTETWREMPEEKRRQIHLVSLPMDDPEENAAMVNALQRRADVLVQKSLAEGFGLTVTEAMWKSKPVVGSCVGGIKDQIVDGESGVLIDDPRDLESFAGAIRSLLEDPERAAEIGQNAHRRVTDRYLGANRLKEYVALLASLLNGEGASRS